ncbi:MAG TPA: hypothetical protein VGL12_05750 [Roseiarcus sp.]
MRIDKAERQRVSETEPLLMSRTEAARALGGIHIQTVTKLARAKKLERVFVGRRSMLTVASVRALASGRTATPTPTPTRFNRRRINPAKTTADAEPAL